MSPGYQVGQNHDDIPSSYLLDEELAMATVQTLDGAEEVRVDCGCDGYSKEIVVIPHVVVFDALEQGLNVRVAARDERIKSRRAGGIESKPTRDFKPLHLAQVAATMRSKGLLPISPFVRPETLAVVRLRPEYAAWLKSLRAAREGTAALREHPGTGVPMEGVEVAAGEVGTLDEEWSDAGADEYLDEAPPGPSGIELAATFPVMGTIEDIKGWVEDSADPAQRARYAFMVERQRRDKARPSLIEWLEAEWLGPSWDGAL